MQKQYILYIAVGAVGLVLLVFLLIFVFIGRESIPVPEIPVSPSPGTFGVGLPRQPFFIQNISPSPERQPTPSPTIDTTPEPSPKVTTIPFPFTQFSPTPVRLSKYFENKIAEIKAEGRTYITESELFGLQWPREYREKLSYLQDSIITQRLLPESARRNFSTQNDIIEFLQSSLPLAVSNGIISETDASRFSKSINNELLIVKQIETQLIQQRLKEKSDTSKPKLFASITAPAPEIMTLGKSAVAIFKEMLYPKTATGQGIQLGIPCLQEITRTPGLGPALWAPCCRCFAGKFPIGCLNFVCAGKSAIWDSITGICGCDF